MIKIALPRAGWQRRACADPTVAWFASTMKRTHVRTYASAAEVVTVAFGPPFLDLLAPRAAAPGRPASDRSTIPLNRTEHHDVESFLMGTALGLFAGIIPGPFLALVAATALRRGLGDGLKTALVPLVTEIPVLVLSVLVLTQLSPPLLRWIGVAGGVLMLYMAWRVVSEAREADPADTVDESLIGHYFRVAAVGLLSPSPWVFWFIIAGPLFLTRWHVSWIHGIVFLAAFFLFFVGMMMLVAWAASTGRDRLSRLWYRRALRGTAALLAVLGTLLVWQSAEGNFQEWVQPQRTIEHQIRSGL